MLKQAFFLEKKHGIVAATGRLSTHVLLGHHFLSLVCEAMLQTPLGNAETKRFFTLFFLECYFLLFFLTF